MASPRGQRVAQRPALTAHDARRAEGDEPAARAQQAVAAPQRRATQRVQHDVERRQPAVPPGARVVQRVLDPEAADGVVLARRCGAPDLRASVSRQLVAAMPTPPAAAWISTRSPRSQAGRLEQGGVAVA
jgi:hypothetical protein